MCAGKRDINNPLDSEKETEQSLNRAVERIKVSLRTEPCWRFGCAKKEHSPNKLHFYLGKLQPKRERSKGEFGDCKRWSCIVQRYIKKDFIEKPLHIKGSYGSQIKGSSLQKCPRFGCSRKRSIKQAMKRKDTNLLAQELRSFISNKHVHETVDIN